MVEEYGVHGFAQVVVATEGKGEVAHTTAHVCSRQVGAYPLRSTDEIDGVAVVGLYTRSHSQDIGIKNNVLGRHTYHIDQQMISTLTDSDATFIRVGLSLFIKCHHHYGSTEAVYLASMSKEGFLALLERYGVDNALALYALDGCRDNLPAR